MRRIEPTFLYVCSISANSSAITCVNVVHMATKHEWTAFDYASQQAAAKIIADSRYSYRAISDLMSNAVSHVRISDIEKGRKAPIKLSKFLLLCQACEVDPVVTLKEIIGTANANPNAHLKVETPDE